MVNPEDYKTVLDLGDGLTYEYYDLPADEWRCCSCSGPIGLNVVQGEDGYRSVIWTPAFYDELLMANEPSTTRYCEECVPHE